MDGLKYLDQKPNTVIDSSSDLTIKSLAVSDTITVGVIPSNLRPITNSQVLTPSFSTVYRNTNNTSMFISISLGVGTINETFNFYAGASNPPTTVIASVVGYSSGAFMSVIVLPNQYYYITKSGAGAINKWVQFF